ncbi:hypothetical protein Tco_1422518, partial [Tanacetum coccineum]
VKRIKQLEEELVGSKKEVEKLRKERRGLTINLGQAEIVSQKMVHEFLPAFVKIGRKKESLKVIMQDTSNLDVAAPFKFE